MLDPDEREWDAIEAWNSIEVGVGAPNPKSERTLGAENAQNDDKSQEIDVPVDYAEKHPRLLGEDRKVRCQIAVTSILRRCKCGGGDTCCLSVINAQSQSGGCHCGKSLPKTCCSAIVKQHQCQNESGACCFKDMAISMHLDNVCDACEQTRVVDNLCTYWLDQIDSWTFLPDSSQEHGQRTVDESQTELKIEEQFTLLLIVLMLSGRVARRVLIQIIHFHTGRTEYPQTFRDPTGLKRSA